MNNKLIIVGNPSSLSAMERLTNLGDGFDVEVISESDIKDKLPSLELDRNICPVIVPIDNESIGYEYSEPTDFSGTSKHYKGSEYYNKKISKRRKKNKNKKTHRK